jgi:RNA polymerase sigma-70 factor (ECF subfamily)
VNDTYLRAWETIPPTRPVSLGGYLTKIIRSIAINRYDRDRRDRRIPPEAVESLSDFEGFLADTPAPDEAESALIGEVISRYLRGCKKRRRYIFMARFYAARPVAEIAQRLGVSQSSVKRELAGIRKELRNELEKEGITV